MIMRFLCASLAFAAVAHSAHCDEGMWLPNQPPLAALKQRYGFEPSPEWMEHLQKSAVRISSGGSGSLVSADGLVLTNHHVGSECLAQLSTPGHDLGSEGFIAKSRAEELKCPALELDILWSIEDVTARVNDATAADMDAATAGAARRSAIAAIESESQRATGLKSEVVTLFQGGRYHLYAYKTYRDVRLVFAPESDAAYFGGDTDNFEFPRFDLDCCFFRVYENDAPLKSAQHLTWSRDGAKADELVFVWGHPGRTQRLDTYDHLLYLRDVELPLKLAGLWRSEVKLQSFIARSDANARAGRESYGNVQNSRKAYTGLIEGLQDPALMSRKKLEEASLRAKLGANPDDLQRFDAARAKIAQSLAAQRTFAERYELIERGWRGADLVVMARNILRLVAEEQKPNGERLTEYGDANRESLLAEIYSTAPLDDSMQIEAIALQLSRLVERLGGSDPLVVKLLAGRSPRDRARELVASSTIREPAARKALVSGGAAAVASSPDPLLAFVGAMDNEARAIRSRFEDEVESVQRRAYSDIAAGKFSVEGDAVYPDATFTLRLSYGTVKGYEENGTTVAPFTTFAGLFARAKQRFGQEGFRLTPTWEKARTKLALDTPFNFVCSADIIGGNSGSPVVNKAGELVGLIFDGNIQSLVGDVLFDESQNRAVAVDSRGMLAALKVVYGADALVAEIAGTNE